MAQSDGAKPLSLWDWMERLILLISFLTVTAGFFDYTANTRMLHRISISAFLIYFLATLWFVLRGEARQAWKWASLIVLYGVTAGLCYWIGSWQGAVAAAPSSSTSNLVRRFDFESGLPKAVSLGVCDDTPTWYDVCHEAPNRFQVVSGGFAGEKSLGVQVEALPEKGQVYSLRLPVDPPVFADAVAARVYIPHKETLSKITLAARVKGENTWIFSDMKPAADGWLYFLVDTQPYQPEDLPSDLAIDEIHIGIFVSGGSQVAGDEQILLDDIELYYPLGRPFKTAPMDG